MSESRVALVTGGSLGIGAGITEYLSRHNYFVHATYLKHKEAAQKAFTNNQNVCLHSLDVRSEENVKQVIDAVIKESEKIHLLVNNAGVDLDTPIETATLSQWGEIFGVRCTGTFLTTKYCLPHFKKNKRSTIINITSSFAHEAQPDFPPVAAAEAAKMSFTKSCALALAKYGVRTHSVNPGVTRTPLWDIWNVDEAGWEKMAKDNPLGRNCTPEDVAKVIFYLDSEEAAYLNGEEIYVNGGNHLKS